MMETCLHFMSAFLEKLLFFWLLWQQELNQLLNSHKTVLVVEVPASWGWEKVPWLLEGTIMYWQMHGKMEQGLGQGRKSAREQQVCEPCQGQWSILWAPLQLLASGWVCLPEYNVGWQRQIEAYQISSQTCMELNFVQFWLRNGPEAWVYFKGNLSSHVSVELVF